MTDTLPQADTAPPAEHPMAVAIRWARRGFPAFPIALAWDPTKAATNKRPLTPRGHLDATTDPDIVRDWFTATPLPMLDGEVLGVGIRPGPAGVIVLDADVHGGVDGPGHADQVGATGTWVVDTASGGEHRYFLKPDRARQYSNTVPEGWRGLVDVRADSGWIVAPGVTTPWGSWRERSPWQPGKIKTLPPQLEAQLSNGHSNGATRWRRYQPDQHNPQLDQRTVIALDMLTSRHGVEVGLVTFHTQAGREPWLELTRPGKTGGVSATLGYVAPGVLNVFTTGWPAFPPGPHDLVGPTLIGEPTVDGDNALVVRLSTVTPERVTWLWEGRIPAGKLVTLDGDPGVGKSTLSLAVAAHLTTGRTWPDGTPCPVGNVLLLSGEDGLGDTVRPRLDAAGANPDRVFALEGIRLSVDGDDPVERDVHLGDVAHLERVIGQHHVALVIVDVLMAYLPSGVDSHKDQDIRTVLRRLAGIADKTGAAVLLLRHLNKTGGGSALYRGGGSIGIVGAARSGLLAGRDPDDPDLIVLASSKMNLGPRPAALSYRIEDADGVGVVRWGDPVDRQADDLLHHGRDNDRDERDALVEFLVELLDEHDGQLPAVEGERAVRDAFPEVTKPTMYRAKKKARIVSKKTSMGSGWVWCLPEEFTKGTKNPGTREPEIFVPFVNSSQPADGGVNRVGHVESAGSGLREENSRGKPTTLLCRACGEPMLADFDGDGIHPTCHPGTAR